MSFYGQTLPNWDYWMGSVFAWSGLCAWRQLWAHRDSRIFFVLLFVEVTSLWRGAGGTSRSCHWEFGDRSDLAGGGTRVHCQRRGWSVRKARYHCLYTNPSLVKDPFVILVLFRLGICPDYRRGEGNVACPASEEELCLSHAEVGTAAERTASLPLPSAMRSSKTGELAQAFINILGSFYWPSLKGETCTKAVQSCFSWKVVTCWRPGRS